MGIVPHQIWRPGGESNPRIEVLQTPAFPLRHQAETEAIIQQNPTNLILAGFCFNWIVLLYLDLNLDCLLSFCLNRNFSRPSGFGFGNSYFNYTVLYFGFGFIPGASRQSAGVIILV